MHRIMKMAFDVIPLELNCMLPRPFLLLSTSKNRKKGGNMVNLTHVVHFVKYSEVYLYFVYLHISKNEIFSAKGIL